jgi:glycerophosphoryl diester phosphodiesterase
MANAPRRTDDLARAGKRPVLNIAHRGASAEFPENTLAAFAAALRAGAHMCELDVHRSADGALVVIHDETVDRTTEGCGRVEAMTLSELKRLDAGRWRDAKFAGERIPTLQEVFDAVGDRCALNIELKGTGVEEQVCRMIREWGVERTALVSSFDWSRLARLRKIAPEIRIGLLAERAPARLINAAVRMNAWAINPGFKLVKAELCAAAHRHGLKVYAWTVDDPDQMQRMKAEGVDGIMTNCPDRLRAVIES